MARVKTARTTRARHKKILKQAKGYCGAKHYRFRNANQAVMKSLSYAYVGRKDKKSNFRKLWIARINAAARMNGKTGAVCAFLYLQIEPFGKKMKDGILIDFQITNDDIAGFCGISTRNSVNRILRGLRENGIISIADQKILIKDKEYLEQYVKG